MAVGRLRRCVSRIPWHCMIDQRRAGQFVGFSSRELISIDRQPMPIATSRCYLIQMLTIFLLTCANGCSCWSADEENSPKVFPYHGCALPTELGGQVTVLQLEVDIVAAIHSTCPRRWRTGHCTGHEHPVPKHRHRRDRQGPATELDPRRLAWLGRPLLCWSCDARTSSTCTASGWHLSPAR